MKIRFASSRRGAAAIILLLALLIVMMVIVGANYRSLCNLDRELKTIERRQIQRLNAGSATNAVAVPSPSPRTNASAAVVPAVESPVAR